MSLRPNARAEVCWNRYKVAVDAEEGRRQREDKMVEIRKSKREESLLKKRREGLQAQQFPSSVHTTTVEKKLGSHTKKRPDNLVIGQTYDHHIYDLIELGVENFKSMQSFSYDKKIAPLIGTKPFFAFIGEGFENVEELKHLKEILLDLFRGQQVVTNLNLVGLD